MPFFKKESLETLKQRIDLVEVLSSHIELKRSGASYKGLCPFHDEKTPSFMIQKGDSHYHCFGCGAHGDAIQFLMSHQKMNFVAAVNSLAERFGVPLELVEQFDEKKGPNKGLLKEALFLASQLYHFYLLHTEEGHEALNYLYSRGIDLEFIQTFQLGLAPKNAEILRKAMHQKSIRDDILSEVGLLTETKAGQWKDFFLDRIMFPIHNAMGEVIGFSGRKYKESTFGGKYVNTPETALFKKSRVLFGLHHCRRRIAKERRAIIVEGQIDALRLIQEGFNLTVAGQGTAFGEEHVKELVHLGVNQVYLALDADQAGQEAAKKIGNLFQKEGVDAKIVQLPQGSDPDSFLREKGPEAFLKLLEKSGDYLTFLIRHLSQNLDIHSPAGKNELLHVITKMVREWNHPVMVHETLKKLAHQLQLPEDVVGVNVDPIPNIYIRKSESVGIQTIDPDKIIEGDLLRWMLVIGQEKSHLIKLIRNNIKKEDLKIDLCKKIFEVYLKNEENQRPFDFLSLIIDVDDPEAQLFISDLLQRRINKDRAEEKVNETIQKILDRNWMQQREAIKIKIQSGKCSDDEVLELAKEFDALKSNPPTMISAD